MFFMMNPRNRNSFFAAFLILVSVFLRPAFAQVAAGTISSTATNAVSNAAQAEKPKQKLPVGISEITGYQYPVYLYAPKTIQSNKKYPLLFMVPSQTDTAEKQLEAMIPVAKSLECFVLAPYNAWPQDVPFDTDRWLLKVNRRWKNLEEL